MSADRPFLKKEYGEIVQDLLFDLGTAEGGRTALTDATDGSVVHTLVETFGRQLAVAYEQLEHVYRSGYLDTAESIALDNVVALFGVSRRRAGRLEGMVTFSRLVPAREDIPIPSGTQVSGRDAPLCETTKDGVLLKGAKEITVPVRSVEPAGDQLAADALTMMPAPIGGVEGVTNRAPLVPRTREELDDELRERARRTVRASRKGTVGAIEQAVAALGLEEVAVRESVPERPGEVEVILGDERVDDDTLERARHVVEEVRPAGVHVEVRGVDRIRVDVTATLELDDDRPEHERAALREEIEAGLTRYFQQLGVADNVRWAKVRNILAGHDRVTEVHGTGETPFLDPRVGPGAGDSELTTRGLKNRDVFIGSRERSQMGVVRLTPEPPSLDVWLDVEAVLEADVADEGLADSIASGLRLVLPTEPLDTSQTLGYNDLVDAISPSARASLKRITLSVVHDRDGRVTVLSDANDEAQLDERERVEVRHVYVVAEEPDA